MTKSQNYARHTWTHVITLAQICGLRRQAGAWEASHQVWCNLLQHWWQWQWHSLLGCPARTCSIWCLPSFLLVARISPVDGLHYITKPGSVEGMLHLRAADMLGHKSLIGLNKHAIMFCRYAYAFEELTRQVFVGALWDRYHLFCHPHSKSILCKIFESTQKSQRGAF